MQDLHPLAGTDVVVPAGDEYGLEAPLRMHVVEHGRRDGIAVLMLHGLPTTSYLWRDVARDLGQEHLCLMPDLIGLGSSEKPLQRRPYALDAQARVVHGVLDALQVDRVVAVGHDLGGAVAVHLAALAPQRVAGIVLIDSPVHAEVWPVPSVLPLLTPGIAQAEVGLLRHTPTLARKVLTRSLGSTLAPRELDSYLSPLLSADGGAALLRFVRAVDLAAVEAAWRVICAGPPPALVLWGEADRLHRTAYGRRVAREIGGAWVPVSEGDHLLPQQRPERVAEEIAGFSADLP
jgi:pimeloyl-ACP methyl ester carboxylesterase